MPSSFDNEFAAGSARDYIALFGEAVIYEPKDGTQRNIQAVIDREGLQVMQQIVDLTQLCVSIEALDDDVEGIAWATVERGGDHVTFSPWPGQAPVRLPLSGRNAKPVGGLCSVRVGGL